MDVGSGAMHGACCRSHSVIAFGFGIGVALPTTSMWSPALPEHLHPCKSPRTSCTRPHRGRCF